MNTKTKMIILRRFETANCGVNSNSWKCKSPCVRLDVSEAKQFLW